MAVPYDAKASLTPGGSWGRVSGQATGRTYTAGAAPGLVQRAVNQHEGAQWGQIPGQAQGQILDTSEVSPSSAFNRIFGGL